MGIKSRMVNRTPRQSSHEDLMEKFYRDEKDYRADRLVEKWSRVPDVGKGIESMPARSARNLAIYLENQARGMSRMTETQLSSNFFGLNM